MQSRIPILCATTILTLGFAAAVPAQEQSKDQLTYVEKTKYPVIEEMEAQNDELRAAAEAKTEEILDQDSREFRFINQTSTDDHGIHLVGITTIGDHDWFLIKDSNRSSRLGQHEGHYFYRDDYVRLKMLTITVPKARVADILERVESE